MNTHAKITALLYDYHRGELPSSDRLRVEEHCAGCRRCRQEFDELRAMLALLPLAPPSDERTPEFWRSFPDAVERRLTAPGAARSRAGFWEGVRDEIVSLFTLRPAYAAAVSGSVVLALLAVVLWQQYTPGTPSPSQAAQPAVEIPVRTVSTDVRMSDYFRKSKMLLVGISNMKVSDGGSVDMSAERKYSRELLHEARYLKTQPMSGRSAKLIGDLEKILIELANLKDQGEAPEVEMIRGGIHQENLLFKIRAAASVYDSTRFQQTRALY